jgi:hypothetical protein
LRSRSKSRGLRAGFRRSFTTWVYEARGGALAHQLPRQQELAELLQRGLGFSHGSPPPASLHMPRHSHVGRSSAGREGSCRASRSRQPSRSERPPGKPTTPVAITPDECRRLDSRGRAQVMPPAAFHGLACVEATQLQAVGALASCEPRRDNRRDGYRHWPVETAVSSEGPRNQAFYLLNVGIHDEALRRSDSLFCLGVRLRI